MPLQVYKLGRVENMAVARVSIIIRIRTRLVAVLGRVSGQGRAIIMVGVRVRYVQGRAMIMVGVRVRYVQGRAMIMVEIRVGAMV